VLGRGQAVAVDADQAASTLIRQRSSALRRLVYV
jgi:hypothetical protein